MFTVFRIQDLDPHCNVCDLNLVSIVQDSDGGCGRKRVKVSASLEAVNPEKTKKNLLITGEHNSRGGSVVTAVA